MMKKSIKNKFIITCVIAMISVTTVSILFVYIYNKNVFLENEKANLKLRSTEMAHALERLMIESEKTAQTISKLPEVVSYLSEANPESQQKSLLYTLNSFNLNETDSVIYLLDINGKALVSTDAQIVGNNYAFRKYFREALSQGSGIEPAIGIVNKKFGIYFSDTILDSNGRAIGVAVINITEQYLINSFFAYEGLDGLDLMMTDNYGIIDISKKTDRQFKSLGALSEFKVREIKDQKSYGDLDISSLTYKPIQKALPAISQAQIFDFYDSDDNEKEILSVVPLYKNNFYLITEESYEKYTDIALKTAIFLSLIILVIGLLCIVPTYILVVNFFKPLKNFEAIAQEVSQGNFKHIINIKSGDEFESLSNSFNEMTKSLKESRENIEKKVNERTKQLENSYKNSEKINNQLAEANEELHRYSLRLEEANEKISKANADLEKANKAMVGREMRIIEMKSKISALEKEAEDNLKSLPGAKI